MTLAADRRSVLTGLGALAVSGCSSNTGGLSGVVPLDLSALEQAYGGRIGVAAFSGPVLTGWRTEERFLYCSTFKLFLAAAVLQRAAESRDALTRPILVRASDIVPHAPVTGPAVGESLTLETLCKAAVEVSDNAAANILIREMGGLPALQAWYGSIGDTVTRVDRTETALNVAEGEKDTTTPAQFAANLDKVLHRGSALRGEIVPVLTQWLLASPTGPDRIKAAGGAGWRVAHKTGTNDAGQTNDIGVMYGPDASMVTLAIFYDGPASASAGQRDAAVAEAARQVLKVLGHD